MIDKYVQYLLNQIKHPPRILSCKERQEDLLSLYFGGGTPSSLQTSQLVSIISAMKHRYNFSPHIEITLETTPDKVTKDNLESWLSMGINRLSMGIQTLNDKALKEIKRGDSEEIYTTLDLIETSDFQNISVDFIIGLPYVKVGETQSNIEFILKKYKKIKHVSVYMLEEYYDVNKLEGDSKFEDITYPSQWKELGISEDDYLQEYTHIYNFLESEGFSRYEISNYARFGYECKHNQAYWTQQEVQAFGLGAHGYVNNTRYGFPDDFKKYYTGELEYNEKLTPQESIIEQIMFALRTSGLPQELVRQCNRDKILEFIASGYLEYQGGNLCLNHKGVLVMDHILGEILD